mmetsp:Transcript_40500/g.122035  ORF Transcript_40500/g.122035 Transcript_40500/m.122035 type:complete len:465 (-) Transcript_40500:533-1927(-)
MAPRAIIGRRISTASRRPRERRVAAEIGIGTEIGTGSMASRPAEVGTGDTGTRRPWTPWRRATHEKTTRTAAATNRGNATEGEAGTAIEASGVTVTATSVEATARRRTGRLTWGSASRSLTTSLTLYALHWCPVVACQRGAEAVMPVAVGDRARVMTTIPTRTTGRSTPGTGTTRRTLRTTARAWATRCPKETDQTEKAGEIRKKMEKTKRAEEVPTRKLSTRRTTWTTTPSRNAEGIGTGETRSSPRAPSPLCRKGCRRTTSTTTVSRVRDTGRRTRRRRGRITVTAATPRTRMRMSRRKTSTATTRSMARRRAPKLPLPRNPLHPEKTARRRGTRMTLLLRRSNQPTVPTRPRLQRKSPQLLPRPPPTSPVPNPPRSPAPNPPWASPRQSRRVPASHWRIPAPTPPNWPRRSTERRPSPSRLPGGWAFWDFPSRPPSSRPSTRPSSARRLTSPSPSWSTTIG